MSDGHYRRLMSFNLLQFYPRRKLDEIIDGIRWNCTCLPSRHERCNCKKGEKHEEKSLRKEMLFFVLERMLRQVTCFDDACRWNTGGIRAYNRIAFAVYNVGACGCVCVCVCARACVCMRALFIIQFPSKGVTRVTHSMVIKGNKSRLILKSESFHSGVKQRTPSSPIASFPVIIAIVFASPWCYSALLSKCKGVEIHSLKSHHLVSKWIPTLKIMESTLKGVIQTTTLEWILL